MSYHLILVAITWILIAVAIVHVVLDNRQPAKTMAWALVILFIPVVGIILYLFFGMNHRKERLISQRSLDQLAKRSMVNFDGQHNLQVPSQYRQLVDLFINQDLSVPLKSSHTDILTDGYSFVHSLLRDIAAARHHIHIAMYIFADDALGRLMADALLQKSREGVEVRVIYDDVGCWNVGRRFFERLREGGIEAVSFLPVHFPSFTSKANYRNHRKLVIVDGKVGYIGGMNMACRYVKGIKGVKGVEGVEDIEGVKSIEGTKGGQAAGNLPWRDTMLRFQGTIVHALQRAFLVDWYFVDRTLITSREYYPAPTGSPRQGAAGDAAESSFCPSERALAQVVTCGPMAPYPEIMQGYVYAILTARRYVFIQTPYFLPNEPVLFALKTAAVSGVDVRIMCPLRSDAHITEWASRSYLRELHEAGAKVLLYQAGFLHSKLLVCDDLLASCGSTNVDFRSFENNFEANVFIYDEATAQRLKQVFLDDQQQSIPLEQVPSWLHPKFFPRLWQSVTRLLSPLL